MQEYTKKYTQAFLEDCRRAEHRASGDDREGDRAHRGDGALHRRTARQGLCLRTDDGSYYFRIAKFPEYGKLSKKDFAGMTDGARVDVDEYEKDNARDFALWKAPKPGEASGTRRSGRDVRAGTSSARRCR